MTQYWLSCMLLIIIACTALRTLLSLCLTVKRCECTSLCLNIQNHGWKPEVQITFPLLQIWISYESQNGIGIASCIHVFSTDSPWRSQGHKLQGQCQDQGLQNCPRGRALVLDESNTADSIGDNFFYQIWRWQRRTGRSNSLSFRDNDVIPN